MPSSITQIRVTGLSSRSGDLNELVHVIHTVILRKKNPLVMHINLLEVISASALIGAT